MAIKVSQATINEIQKLGMKGALAKWNSGQGSEEFNEAIQRYYGKGHRARASSGGTAAESAPSAPSSKSTSVGSTSAPKTESKTIPMPSSAPASATRQLGSSSVDSDVPGSTESPMAKYFRAGKSEKRSTTPPILGSTSSPMSKYFGKKDDKKGKSGTLSLAAQRKIALESQSKR